MDLESKFMWALMVILGLICVALVALGIWLRERKCDHCGDMTRHPVDMHLLLCPECAAKVERLNKTKETRNDNND